MRIADLSRRGGVSVATIKFYLREGLLPPGTPTGRNQAAYDDGHLMRLRVIRILTSLGGHSLSAVRELFTALDENPRSRDVSQVVNRILGVSGFEEQEATGWARGQVDALVRERGWRVDSDTPGRAALVQILAAFKHVDPDCDTAAPLASLACFAEQVAGSDVASIADRSAVTFAARTVLVDAAFAAIRRMAQEHMLTEPAPPRTRRVDIHHAVVSPADPVGHGRDLGGLAGSGELQGPGRHAVEEPFARTDHDRCDVGA